MAKFSNETLLAIVAAANDLNYKGKRLASTKRAVVEKIADTLDLDIEQVDKFLQRKTYASFWAELDKANEKVSKKRASNKLAHDTMTGNKTAKIGDIEIIAGERFIVTTAQNNTNVAPVMTSLIALSNQLEAKLIVLPAYYNKAAFSPAAEGNDRDKFDKAVQPYLQESDCWLGEKYGVRLVATANIVPTAKLPVNSAAMLNAGELATIVPSPKQQLVTLPRLNNAPIKEAWSTGSCTQFNYIESRAGSEAEIEHVFGALVITYLGNGEFDITNIREGVDGSLLLDGMDYASGLQTTSALVLGDLHCEMQDVNAWRETVNYITTSKPAAIAVHDILHFETRSHHNVGSAKHWYKMAAKDASVKNDLVTVITQLNELAELTGKVYVVESNHNSALDSWLENNQYNPKQDPTNAKIYHLLNYAICEMIDAGFDKPALELALTDMADLADLPQLADNIVFGRMDTAEMWNGFDVSQHGHKGQNGSAGNSKLFSKWRLPLVTGHTHSPAIFGNCYTVGVMAKLNQGYNRGGASSWNQGNMIIQVNGTVQFKRVFPLSKTFKQ